MKRFATSLAIAVGSLTLGLAQAPDLAKDERLAKPITVRLKMVTLPDAVKSLSDASGVPLEAAVPLKDLKVTILVKDQPAHLVMAKVASTLDLEWEADGSSFRIKANDDIANAQRKYLEQEDKFRRKATEERLQKLMAAANQPYVQAKARDAQLTPEAYLLGQAFRNLGANGWTAFWNGRTVRNSAPLEESAATPPANQNPPPPQAEAPQQGPSGQEAQGRRRDRPARTIRMIRVAAQYDPIMGRMFTNFENAGGSGIQGILTEPTGELTESTYGKRISAWAARNEKSDAFQKAFTPVTPVSGGWYGNRLSIADMLEAFHKASGVPVVADAFRVASATGVGGNTPAAWLESVAGVNRAFLRTEDGFAMLRHGGFWRLRQLDVPERIARPLEAAKAPSLEDYAAFAGALNEPQMMFVRQPNLILLRVNHEPLRTGMSALRFYASLGSLQAKARQNQPIPFGVLGAAQKNLFLDAFEGGFDGGALVGRGNNIDLNQEGNALAFLMTLVDVPNRGAGGAMTMGSSLLFGTRANDGVAYTIPVPPRS